MMMKLAPRVSIRLGRIAPTADLSYPALRNAVLGMCSTRCTWALIHEGRLGGQQLQRCALALMDALGRLRHPDLISPRQSCVNSFGRNFNDTDLDGGKVSGNILDSSSAKRGSDQRQSPRPA
jgi:hypothetical protein